MEKLVQSGLLTGSRKLRTSKSANNMSGTLDD